MIIIYDDFKSDPISINKSIFKFLEVDETFLPDMSAKPNVSGIPKNKLAQNLMSSVFDKDNVVRTLSRKLLSEEVRWRFTSYWRNQNLKKIEMSSNIRSKLTEYFRDDINSLQTLIDRDLTQWLT